MTEKTDLLLIRKYRKGFLGHLFLFVTSCSRVQLTKRDAISCTALLKSVPLSTETAIEDNLRVLSASELHKHSQRRTAQLKRKESLSTVS